MKQNFVGFFQSELKYTNNIKKMIAFVKDNFDNKFFAFSFISNILAEASVSSKVCLAAKFIADIFLQASQSDMLLIQAIVLPKYQQIIRTKLAKKEYSSGELKINIQDLIVNGLKTFSKLYGKDQQDKFQSLFRRSWTSIQNEKQIPGVQTKFFNKLYEQTFIKKFKQNKNEDQFQQILIKLPEKVLAEGNNDLLIRVSLLGNYFYQDYLYKAFIKIINKDVQKLELNLNRIRELAYSGRVWQIYQIQLQLVPQLKKLMQSKLNQKSKESLTKFIAQMAAAFPDKKYRNQPSNKSQLLKLCQQLKIKPVANAQSSKKITQNFNHFRELNKIYLKFVEQDQKSQSQEQPLKKPKNQLDDLVLTIQNIKKTGLAVQQKKAKPQQLIPFLASIKKFQEFNKDGTSMNSVLNEDYLTALIFMDEYSLLYNSLKNKKVTQDKFYQDLKTIMEDSSNLFYDTPLDPQSKTQEQKRKEQEKLAELNKKKAQEQLRKSEQRKQLQTERRVQQQKRKQQFQKRKQEAKAIQIKKQEAQASKALQLKRNQQLQLKKKAQAQQMVKKRQAQEALKRKEAQARQKQAKTTALLQQKKIQQQKKARQHQERLALQSKKEQQNRQAAQPKPQTKKINQVSKQQLAKNNVQSLVQKNMHQQVSNLIQFTQKNKEDTLKPPFQYKPSVQQVQLKQFHRPLPQRLIQKGKQIAEDILDSDTQRKSVSSSSSRKRKRMSLDQSYLVLPQIQPDIQSNISSAEQTPSSFKQCLQNTDHIIKTLAMANFKKEPALQRLKLQENLKSMEKVLKGERGQGTSQSEVNIDQILRERDLQHRQQLQRVRHFYEKESSFLKKRVQSLQIQLSKSQKIIEQQSAVIKIYKSPKAFQTPQRFSIEKRASLKITFRQSKSPLDQPLAIKQLPQRIKKAMLKSKELLFKNNKIQIGVITSLSSSSLNISLYILAVQQPINDFQLRLIGSDLQCSVSQPLPTSLSEKQQKVNMSIKMPKSLPYKLPMLQVITEKGESAKITLPCSINRFIQFKQINVSNFIQKAKSLPSISTPHYQFYDKKLVKDSQSLLSLIPKLKQLNQEDQPLLTEDQIVTYFAVAMQWNGEDAGLLSFQFLNLQKLKIRVIGGQRQQLSRMVLQTLKELLLKSSFQ